MSLHEFRLQHPHTAAFPTLTQSGLLGQILERQDWKAARLASWRARWRRMFAALGVALALPRRAFEACHA